MSKVITTETIEVLNAKASIKIIERLDTGVYEVHVVRTGGVSYDDLLAKVKAGFTDKINGFQLVDTAITANFEAAEHPDGLFDGCLLGTIAIEDARLAERRQQQADEEELLENLKQNQQEGKTGDSKGWSNLQLGLGCAGAALLGAAVAAGAVIWYKDYR